MSLATYSTQNCFLGIFLGIRLVTLVGKELGLKPIKAIFVGEDGVFLTASAIDFSSPGV